jgi:cytochrome c-type biogenesis protein CcmH/NrfG
VLLLREDIARQLGRTADAEAALARAGRLLPPDRLAAARAEVALGRGDPEDAVGHLQAAVARVPNDADLWVMLGAARGRIGQYDGAIEAYERAVALRPSPLACKTLAALLFEIRHDRSRAVELWRKSLDLDPHQPDVQRFLAMYGGH